MSAVVVATVIDEIYEGGDYEYSDQTNEGGVVERFQCVDCGWIIQSGGRTIDDQEQLYLALLNQEIDDKENNNGFVRVERTNTVR